MTKKSKIKICTEICIIFEQEADDDDYNNVKCPEMRPVTSIIIKVKDEDDFSLVVSYGVIIKKTNIKYGFGVKGTGSGGNILRKVNELGLGGNTSLIKNINNLELGFPVIGKSKIGFSYTYEFKLNNGGISGNEFEAKGKYQIGSLGISSGMGLGMDIRDGSCR